MLFGFQSVAYYWVWYPAMFIESISLVNIRLGYSSPDLRLLIESIIDSRSTIINLKESLRIIFSKIDATCFTIDYIKRKIIKTEYIQDAP